MKPIINRIKMVILGFSIALHGLVSPASAIKTLVKALKEKGYYD